MAARDVAAGVHHDHECRTDRERRERTGTRLDHDLSDRQNEKERSDRLNDQLARHAVSVGRILDDVAGATKISLRDAPDNDVGWQQSWDADKLGG
jgi:hypothetical protein